MLGLLNSGTPLGRGEVDLFFRTFAWLFKGLGGLGASRIAGPVLPTTGYFPLQGTKNHDWAQEIFKWVKIYSGMPDWQADLQQGARKKVIPAGQLFWGQPNRGGFGRQGTNGDGGSNAPENGLTGALSATSSIARQMRNTTGGKSINVIYHPGLLNDPGALIAKLACDTAFHVKMGLKEAPPEGWSFPEEITEMTAIHMGFGVFIANSLLDGSGSNGDLPDGWRWKRRSYMSKEEVLFALAIFCYMTGTPKPLVLSHLRRPLRDAYSRAYKTVKSRSHRLYAAIDQR